MRYSLEWWETPISGEGYTAYSITQGSWQNDMFVVPIHGMRAPQSWERWFCLITAPIWVRVITDESVGWLEFKRPEGPFRGPFYRVIGPPYDSLHEYLRHTGRMTVEARLQEYLISSNENEIHILTHEEPSFQMVKQLAN